jgi:replication factor C subunit 3/5
MITETTIYECIASPHPEDIAKILDTLVKTTDVTSCLQIINSLKANQGLALADIITALSEKLTELDVPAEVMITWLEGLAEVEYRLSGGGGETVQTGAVVGVVRNGAELMAK